jgi:GNAT superfamily N-acetyltransferase|tara:strand:- start:320 stop:739 length:420 start_codon:yes stop_codon:yes gene_type:complete
MVFTLIKEKPSTKDFIMLRKLAGMPARSEEGVRKGIGNSLFSVIIVEEKKGKKRTVGMGRVVGDGGTVYHICDMVVLPELQNQGLGTMIMDAIMEYIHNEAPELSYVNLMADVDGFYQKWGFKEASPTIGMYYRTKKNT